MSSERRDLERAIGARMHEIETLADLGNTEAALALLDSIYSENRDRDASGWLARTVLAEQAAVLFACGRLAEALEKYRQRAERGPLETGEYPPNELAIAQVLNRMGDPQGAVRELERGLEKTPESAVGGALKLLALYAEIAVRQGWKVPVSYRGLLRRVIGFWGLQISADLIEDPDSLAPAIVAAQVAWEAGERRRPGI